LSRPQQKLAPVNGELFRRACSQFATGLAIATVRAADDAPHGLTVNSFTSVSLDPPLVLICIDEQCQALHHFREGGFFAVNILAAGQEALSEAFARRVDNRFEDQEWCAGETGAPLIPGVLATMECRLVNVIELGDHRVMVGEMVAASIAEGSPLVYFRSSCGRLSPSRER
jgi:flavin reductase (DIM6/NTAB) family NADH-FMN oxidoreductase RutF